jgi:probable H4MPT-linked C1 transfer pathway protein
MNEPIDPTVLGLDIGGANLKAAHSTGIALTHPFPLWRQPEQLPAQLRALRGRMPPDELIAVTMTGELCDCYANRREGVLAILGSTLEAAAGTPVRVWTIRGELVDAPQVRDDPLSAAAGNWLALAYLAARYTEGEPALLIDAGSTTTDLVMLEPGRPRPRAYTDRERMQSGELVYTGVRRTPVCAVLGMGFAAEFFATMLDAYLVLGLLPENAMDTATADGRPATRAHAHARLARLWCADAEDVSASAVDALARQAVDTQIAHVCHAVDRVIAGRPAPARVILSGSGGALGHALLSVHPALSGAAVVSLAQRLGPSLSEAACAFALALLAGGSLRTSAP